MRIGVLSEKTGVSRDALRLYEKRGLIRSERHENGYRSFDAAMVRLVYMIRLGQKLGFSLREIEEVFRALNRADLDVDITGALLRDKIVQIEGRIDEMVTLKTMLAETLLRVCPLKA